MCIHIYIYIYIYIYVLFPPNASAQWQPDGFTSRIDGWLLGAWIPRSTSHFHSSGGGPARGNHLSNTTCLMHEFFQHDEYYGNLW